MIINCILDCINDCINYCILDCINDCINYCILDYIGCNEIIMDFISFKIVLMNDYRL